MRWGIWCEFDDGRKNGVWAGENYDGVRTYRTTQEAAYEAVRKEIKFPHCTYAVREYRGE